MARTASVIHGAALSCPSKFIHHTHCVQIELNGETRTLEDNANVAGLVHELGLDGRRLAVEVNGNIIPGAAHSEHALVDGDHVEIVHAIGGG